MSINTFYDEECSNCYIEFNEHTQYAKKWCGRDISLSVPNSHIISVEKLIQKNGFRIHDKIKPRGQGTYEVEVEKDEDGTTSVGGNITYETDGGVKVEAEVKIDTDGNTSGSVKVGGSF